MLAQTVCDGCQPNRAKRGVTHRSKARHNCIGVGCACGSCHPTPPVTQEQYETWMAILGAKGIQGGKMVKEFYVQNSIVLGKMLKEKKLKPE